MERPLQAFCCYAREDQSLLYPLKKHLKPLERRGLITPLQADIDISPGENWKEKISSYLDTAQIILLLISSDFMDSDYCYGIEMKRALERQEQGDVRVIPVILRPTDWKVEPLDALQALPKNAEPVTSKFWHTLDEAFVDVAKGIQIAIEELLLQSLAKIPTIEQIQNPLEEIPDTGMDSHDMTKIPRENSLQTFSGNYTQELPMDSIEQVQSSPTPLFKETMPIQYMVARKSDKLPVLSRLENFEPSVQPTSSKKASAIGISPAPTAKLAIRIRQRGRRNWLFIALVALTIFALIIGKLVFAQQSSLSTSTNHLGTSAQISPTSSGSNSSQKPTRKVSPTVPSNHALIPDSTATVGLQPTASINSSPSATPDSSPTPVPPTLTTTPSNFLVTNTSNYCNVETHGGAATSMTCNVILNNTSQTSSKLNWSASMSPPDYAISPASGSIAAGKSMTISFGTTSGVPCPSTETLLIKGSVNTVQIPIVCSYLFINPSGTLNTSDCTKNGDWICSITLSATGDSINVPWQATANPPAGVTFSDTSGTLVPNAPVEVSITIASTDCPGSSTFAFSGGSLANPATYLDWNC
jgi:hypothetical protein